MRRAAWTIRALRRHVPAAVPGVVFLSGGQSDEDATADLDALNRVGAQPWQVSFSSGRALQAAALKAWAGDLANVSAAQHVFADRAALTGAARRGLLSSSDPGGQLPGDGEPSRTMRTEHVACWRTFRATLPRTRRFRPVRP